VNSRAEDVRFRYRRCSEERPTRARETESVDVLATSLRLLKFQEGKLRFSGSLVRARVRFRGTEKFPRAVSFAPSFKRLTSPPQAKCLGLSRH